MTVVKTPTIIPNNPVFKNLLPTSEKVIYITVVKSSHLILFRSMAEVCQENHTGHANAMCKKNAQHKNVKDFGTCNKMLSKHLEL